MKGYEAIFIFHPSLNEEDRMKLTEKVEKTISENGILHETNYWGRKRFAYPIQNFTDGHFFLFVFDGEGKLPHELKRLTTITESILRSMIIVRKTTYHKKEVPVPEVKPVVQDVKPVIPAVEPVTPVDIVTPEEPATSEETDIPVVEPIIEEAPIVQEEIEEEIKTEESNA